MRVLTLRSPQGFVSKPYNLSHTGLLLRKGARRLGGDVLERTAVDFDTE